MNAIPAIFAGYAKAWALNAIIHSWVDPVLVISTIFGLCWLFGRGVKYLFDHDML